MFNLESWHYCIYTDRSINWHEFTFLLILAAMELTQTQGYEKKRKQHSSGFANIQSLAIATTRHEHFGMGSNEDAEKWRQKYLLVHLQIKIIWLVSFDVINHISKQFTQKWGTKHKNWGNSVKSGLLWICLEGISFAFCSTALVADSPNRVPHTTLINSKLGIQGGFNY